MCTFILPEIYLFEYVYLFCVCACVCVCARIRNYKRHLEYLFYVFDPERSAEEIQQTNEILNILENGFKSADSYKVLCKNLIH